MLDTFTARQKQHAITREVGFRRRVYARKVADGSMTEREAAEQIGIMVAIAVDYRAQADAEDRAGRLL